MTREAAICCAPRASVRVTMAGSSSGVRPTASAGRRGTSPRPAGARYTLMPKIAITRSRRSGSAARRSAGARARTPSRVGEPEPLGDLAEHGVGAVCTHYGAAVPLTTCDPWNSALERFASGVSPGDHPRPSQRVALSCQRGFRQKRSVDARFRQSAGTAAPAARTITSPGTSASRGSSTSWPSRTTVTLVWITASSLVTALLARYSAEAKQGAAGARSPARSIRRWSRPGTGRASSRTAGG